MFCGTLYTWSLLNFNVLSLTSLMWGSFPAVFKVARHGLFLAVAAACAAPSFQLEMRHV